jgi:hypothetical protein
MVLVLAAWPAGAQDGIDGAFRRLWAARDVQQASTAVADVVRSGVTFADALARLKAGRPYSADVPRGVVRLTRRMGGTDFPYDLNIPAKYDPARRYQLRIQLHGGTVARETAERRGDGTINLPSGSDQIYVIPYSWSDAPWWGEAQLENIHAILDSVKRSYNVDENRVVLAGVSDGATAAYYVAMLDTTPFASFLPLNGFVMVLANPQVGAEGELFLNNLLNKPFFMVNGGADPLYPMRAVEPYINHLKAGGLSVEYHPQPNAGHNTAWWPQLKDVFETFVREHPRDPLPVRLTWTSVGKALSNRAHWLVIDRLSSSTDAGSRLRDLNDAGDPPSRRLFNHDRPFGRVDLVRTGNIVEATTRGVAEFTLLLSPDAFDFSQPVKVVANGRVAFEGRVDPSVETLLKWAARDNDRTMLFGAELHVSVK